MRKIVSLALVFFVMTMLLAGCGGSKDGGTGGEGPAWDSLDFNESMDLKYATQFTVSYCEEGYKYITIGDDQELVLVPEGMDVPSDIPKDMMVLEQPLDQIYLVATAAMDYFSELGTVDRITLSSQEAEDWYIEDAKNAMENGDMAYAGKYSTPDYEFIVSSGCDLAIENTMIYHSPEVLEELQNLGIPTLIERSSYETDPRGRLEWIKLYAALFDKEEEAEAYFQDLAAGIDAIVNLEPTGKTVAFFYVTTTGAVNVRKSGDYVAKSIELAGGTYLAFDESEEDNALSTMTIQMESFYSEAKHADVLIYNSTIDGEVRTMDELLAKSPLLADFDAVKSGNVWCVERSFYQESLCLGDLIEDVGTVLRNPEAPESQLHFLIRLK